MTPPDPDDPPAGASEADQGRWTSLGGSAEPPATSPGAGDRPARTALAERDAQDAGGEDADAEPKPATSHTRNLVEWALVIAGAVIVALVVKTFLFQAFWIPSQSMEQTLHKGDRVLVNKLSYKVHDVHRGDVVVFKRPPHMQDEHIKDLIKRVIGLPGERVSIHDGHVFINGKQLDEPYTKGQETVQPGCPSFDVEGIYTDAGLTIPKGKVLVMGDNRGDSNDGRCFGPISQKLIVGRAFWIIWPPSKIGGL